MTETAPKPVERILAEAPELFESLQLVSLTDYPTLRLESEAWLAEVRRTRPDLVAPLLQYAAEQISRLLG